jgi:hypothetical protein
MTMPALKKAINDWMLDVSNEKAMHKSFYQLIDWMNKIRDTYKFGNPHIPSLMRDVITRINRQSNMPRVVKEKLQEARLRIRDEDTLNECFQVIFAVLMIWVNMKGAKVKSVKSLTSELGKLTLDSSSTPPKKKTPKVHAVLSSPPAADSKGPPPTKKTYFKGGDNKKGADNKGKGGGRAKDRQLQRERVEQRWQQKTKESLLCSPLA